MAFKFTSIKEFTYRGKAERWANEYTFAGTAPPDKAGWDALADAVWAAEKGVFGSSVKRAQYYGYTGLEPPAVAGRAYDVVTAPQTGTMVTPSGGIRPSGDVAVVVRFRVGQNVKGRPRYIFKYYHGTPMPDGDSLSSTQIAAIVTALTPLRDGTLPQAYKLCAPDNTLAGVPEVKPYFTTRTLKRRGKRPPRP